MTDTLGDTLLATVPFARTLGIAFAEVGSDRAVASLSDHPDRRNHVGGPHAGAIFTLGETASGAIVLAAFGSVLGRATPLAVDATIAYRKLAIGDVTATATLGRSATDVLAELDAGERPVFPVAVEITRADGAVTAIMTVTWTLRPN
jgi:acyl-coenzyme A thioesterase PaaI-like protein